MKNEYFQNDVIDLRILGDIGSVCIYRFPYELLIMVRAGSFYQKCFPNT